MEGGSHQAAAHSSIAPNLAARPQLAAAVASSARRNKDLRPRSPAGIMSNFHARASSLPQLPQLPSRREP
jgi:hypothetical protein